MITGSCLCGAVRWQIDGALNDMSHCHCSMCRKAHGAPFATYASGASDEFRWTSGEEMLTHYESSPGFIRSFCRRCGSVVPDPADGGQVFVPVGNVDDDPGIRPTSHIFVETKAPWHVIADALDRHDAHANLSDGPNIERPAQERETGGVLHGSCLCGDIAYEVTEPITTVHNCHCTRCQKGRAAAHTTNGFTSADGVTFVRGEDKLVTYKLPEAKSFAQTFCSRCGSAMPRVNKEAGYAAIPFGSLDDDPGRGADDHIYTSSKAVWYDIEDDLPQYVALPD
ncbi:MAG: GFA family protein [Pseudomonadota bacterium]